MKTRLSKSWLQKLPTLGLLALSVGLSVACGGGSDGNSSNNTRMKVDITGLEDLGDDFLYEGWLIVDGAAITSGTFSVDGGGNLSKTEFSVNATDLANASTFVLTIEPFPDADPDPADTHILAGSFADNVAQIEVDHSSALNTDFSTAAGTFILATPSDDSTDATNNNEGIWWLDPSGPSASLTLPTLPDGWVYEGWLVGNDGPVSTGTFTSASGADSDGAGATGGSDDAPAFPGQDVIGIDLNDGIMTAVISVEPSPDNSIAPFTLKPLLKAIDNGAATAPTQHTMDANSAALPTGTVTR